MFICAALALLAIAVAANLILLALPLPISRRLHSALIDLLRRILGPR